MATVVMVTAATATATKYRTALQPTAGPSKGRNQGLNANPDFVFQRHPSTTPKSFWVDDTAAGTRHSRQTQRDAEGCAATRCCARPSTQSQPIAHLLNTAFT